MAEVKDGLRTGGCRRVAALTHHVSQPHVQEEARGDGGDPLFGGQVGGHGQGDVEADEGEHGAAHVEEQSSAHRHAAVQQNGKVAWSQRESAQSSVQK